jgi:hypothetical protein
MLIQGPTPFPPTDVIPPGAIEIVQSFFVTIAVIALGIPIIRAITRRWERGATLPPASSPEVVARLERIEQAVEAVAVEVERIAEAQRFSAKLMAEQQRAALPRSDT